MQNRLLEVSVLEQDLERMRARIRIWAEERDLVSLALAAQDGEEALARIHKLLELEDPQ